jgi:hypothetical protein
MPRRTRSEAAAERRDRKARQAAADRAVKARANRRAKGRPTKRDVDDAIGEAFVSVLQCRGMVRETGELNEAALARCPELEAVAAGTTEVLAARVDAETQAPRFDPDQVAEVLAGRLATGWTAPEPDQEPDRSAVNAALAEALLEVVARTHPDLLEAKSLIGRPVAFASAFAKAVRRLETEDGHGHAIAVRAVSLRVRQAIADAKRTGAATHEEQPPAIPAHA